MILQLHLAILTLWLYLFVVLTACIDGVGLQGRKLLQVGSASHGLPTAFSQRALHGEWGSKATQLLSVGSGNLAEKTAVQQHLQCDCYMAAWL